MIDLDRQHLSEVIAILSRLVPECEVWAFGSRVSGRAAKYSDLDLVLIGSDRLDWRRLEALKDAFSESDIPISVDVLDWHAVSESFRSIITSSHEIIKTAEAASTSCPQDIDPDAG